jgi:hypothetical protein
MQYYHSSLENDDVTRVKFHVILLGKNEFAITAGDIRGDDLGVMKIKL